MEEKTAKTKWCPHVSSTNLLSAMFTAYMIGSVTSSESLEIKSKAMETSMDEFSNAIDNSCKGSECVMWSGDKCGLTTK